MKNIIQYPSSKEIIVNGNITKWNNTKNNIQLLNFAGMLKRLKSSLLDANYRVEFPHVPALLGGMVKSVGAHTGAIRTMGI